MSRRLFLASYLVAFVATSAAVPAYGQEQKSPADFWTDAIYYFKVGRMDLGEANLQAFLNAKPKPLDVLVLSEEDPRGVEILIKLQSDKKLGELAGAVLALRDQGWHQQRRDPARIAAELERLGGSPRGQFLAVTRLKESGEYAIPVMVQYLSDPTKNALHGRIIDALVKLEQSALPGLVVAVQHAENTAKLLIIEALAALDYAQVLPYLKELAEDDKLPASVRSASANAIETILQRNPKYRVDADAAKLYHLLAERYYTRDSAVVPAVPSPALVPDVRAQQPNIWLWREGTLVDQPVPWEIYYELMTMRLTRRAIELNGRLDEALTLYLLANCRRELRLSETVPDPLHDANFPTAAYFLRTAGTRQCLAVLDRALADHDVAPALHALAALTDVAAGKDVLEVRQDRQPIVDALNYPNQLVRFRAALALGWSAPAGDYPSADTVVPLLGKALAGPDKPVAVAVTGDKEKSDQLKPILEKLGFEVAAFPSFEEWQKGLDAIKSRIELIVVDFALPTPGASQIVSHLQRDPLLKLAPTIVFAAPDQLQEATTVLKDRAQVAVVPGVPDENVLTDRLGYLQRELGRQIAGPEQAKEMALSAAKALGRLATMNLKNYPVERVTQALAEGAARPDWDLAHECAKVLPALDRADAQQGLAAAALGKEDLAQKITMFALLRSSITHWGRHVTDDQVKQFQQIVLNETNVDLRDAAAAVVGALNLKAEEARNVVLTKEGFGKVEPWASSTTAPAQ